MTERGPFEVIELLGEGAYGTVVSARRRESPESPLVALKVLKKEFVQNKDILRSTRDEARILRYLNHPNIISVEELLVVGGAPVMVMELVRGICVEEILLEEGAGLPLGVALGMLEQLANALHCAHFETVGEDGRDVQILHRDIKSSNLLLSVGGAVKLVDFGIASCELRGAEEALNAVTMGSRPYMAPERLDGGLDKPSIDIYSMGVLLYELLTGEFLKLSINHTRHDAMLEEQTAELTVETEVVSLAKGVCGLIVRMCAYDPMARPSAQEVISTIHTLEALVPESERETLESFAKRRVAPLYAARDVSVPAALVSGDVVKPSNLIDVSDEPPWPANSGVRVRWRKWRHLIGFAVVGLLLFAMIRMLWEDGGEYTTVSMPAGSHGWIDGEAIRETSQMKILPGDHIVVVRFEVGMEVSFSCSFATQHAVSIQYVVDDGYAAIQVDDEQPVRCTRQ
jgi:serine/threonine protein kinase